MSDRPGRADGPLIEPPGDQQPLAQLRPAEPAGAGGGQGLAEAGADAVGVERQGESAGLLGMALDVPARRVLPAALQPRPAGEQQDPRPARGGAGGGQTLGGAGSGEHPRPGVVGRLAHGGVAPRSTRIASAPTRPPPRWPARPARRSAAAHRPGR